MKEFWNKNKFSVVIIAFILAMGPFTYFSGRYLTEKIRGTSDQIQETMTDVELEKSKINNIPQMEDLTKEIETNGEALNVVIDDSQEVDFIKSLESLADDTGNKIKISVNDGSSTVAQKSLSASTKDNQEKKGIKDNLSHKNSIVLDIELTGTYDGLVNFVHKMENGKYYANVISIDSRKSSAKDGGDAVSGSAGFFISSSPQGMPVQNSSDSSGTAETLKTKIEIVVYLE